MTQNKSNTAAANLSAATQFEQSDLATPEQRIPEERECLVHASSVQVVNQALHLSPKPPI